VPLPLVILILQFFKRKLLLLIESKKSQVGFQVNPLYQEDWNSLASINNLDQALA